MIEGIIIVLGILLDQWSKAWIYTNLYRQAVSIIPGMLSYAYTENTGAAFGMLSNSTWLLAAASAILAGVLFYVLVKYRKELSKLSKIALAFMISGAIGNLIDRVFRGFVVDFIQVDFVNFAVFNIADIMAVMGTILLILALIFVEYKNVKEITTKNGDDTDGDA